MAKEKTEKELELLIAKKTFEIEVAKIEIKHIKKTGSEKI